MANNMKNANDNAGDIKLAQDIKTALEANTVAMTRYRTMPCHIRIEQIGFIEAAGTPAERSVRIAALLAKLQR